MFSQLIIITIIISQATSTINRLDPVPLVLKPSPSSGPLKSVVCAVNALAISNKKPADGNTFTLSSLNPSLCTHLMLVNAGAIANSRLTVTSLIERMWDEIAWFKNRNPTLQVILSIGGWEVGVKGFQEIGRDERKLVTFVDSVVDYLRNRTVIDSVSILWMWPGVQYRGGDDQDKNDLNLIASKLTTAFTTLPNKPTLGLVLPGNLIGPGYKGYDLKKLSPIISTFYVLAQDFAGNWGGVDKTGHPAPLYAPNNKPSINASISELLKTLPAHKLILGIPFFGRSFLLKNAHPTGLNQEHGGNFVSTFDNNPVGINYQEICHLVKDKKFTVYYDTEVVGMFGVSGKKWVGFDGVDSIREKVDFVKDHALGGVMPWTIDQSDFNGKYCGQKWPLLSGLLPNSMGDDSLAGNDAGIGERNDGNQQHHGHHNDTHSINGCGSGYSVVLSVKILLVFICGFLVHFSI